MRSRTDLLELCDLQDVEVATVERVACGLVFALLLSWA